METFEIRDLNFAYPGGARVIDGLSLTVHEGEFLVICGPSGCGKSTLLRQMKPALAPHGERTGEILFVGRDIDALDLREQSSLIGFVQQSPENQIVTDKVWHELAYGLESLGCDTETIRRRTAEMASFFGIQSWFYRNTAELSGGQKQLLNLASVLAMQPGAILLDEPTSQLDPIAASDFLSALTRINRELGVTVILTEHRLEEVIPLADRIAVMDSGRILCTDTPASAGEYLLEHGHGMFLAMPAAMRVWAAADGQGSCPVTIREGRQWIAGFAKEHEFLPLPARTMAEPGAEPAVELEELWFRYDRDTEDIVKGLTLSVRRGEIFALVGGNGTGKTTSLKLMAGLIKPYRGHIDIRGRAALLPQDPQTLFIGKTVREELTEHKSTPEKYAYTARLCRLENLLDRHPYDLSGGEQQRLALAKLLLTEPDILLLDEPTKGLDAEFKAQFAEILRRLSAEKVTVIMVSHDVEFCAETAGRCAMLFDGSITAEGTPREFFTGNSFYTTAADRISRAAVPGAVTTEELIAVCGGKMPEKTLPEISSAPLPEPEPESIDAVPEHLCLWKRLTAWAAGLTALGVFVGAIASADLSSLAGGDGPRELAEGRLTQYIVFILALAVLAAVTARRAPEPRRVMRKALPGRTIVSAAISLILVPLTLYIGLKFFPGRRYYLTALLVLVECMLPFFLVFEGRRPQARELTLIAVLCAAGVAGRAAFFMLPSFKPVIALVIVTGAALGGETGFLVGAATMLVSNMLFGQGPWTPWQMFVMGLIGLIAGVAYSRGWLRRTRGSLCVFGAIMAVAVYGGIMNPASALIWSGEINIKILISYYVTGFPVDCVQAAATVLFLWFAGLPVLEKLDRVKQKYGMIE